MMALHKSPQWQSKTYGYRLARTPCQSPPIMVVIHQVAQAGFPEEPPKNEQAMLIHAEFSDSAGP